MTPITIIGDTSEAYFDPCQIVVVARRGVYVEVTVNGDRTSPYVFEYKTEDDARTNMENFVKRWKREGFGG